MHYLTFVNLKKRERETKAVDSPCKWLLVDSRVFNAKSSSSCCVWSCRPSHLALPVTSFSSFWGNGKWRESRLHRRAFGLLQGGVLLNLCQHWLISFLFSNDVALRLILTQPGCPFLCLWTLHTFWKRSSRAWNERNLFFLTVRVVPWRQCLLPLPLLNLPWTCS